MFCKNISNSFVGYTDKGSRRYVKPNGVVEVDDAEGQRLIDRGFFAAVEKEEAKQVEAEEQAVKQEKKEAVAIPVEAVKEKKQAATVVANCSAVTQSGKPCSGTRVVPAEEYNADTPYFCGRHKAEDPENYERIEGKWVRKQGR